MSRHTLAVALLAAAVVAPLGAQRPSDRGIVRPADSYEVAPRLEVPPEHRHEMGRLAFTAVLAHPGTWAEVVSALVRRDSRVVPVEQVIPRGMSQQDVNDSNRRLMDESKPVAVGVALRAAGLPVSFHGEGVEVNGVVEDMPARGVLQKGDLVIAVDGQPVQMVAELVVAIRRRQVGEPVRLTLLRNGEQHEVVVGTKDSADARGRPMVGIYVNTRGFKANLPFPVEIDTDGVGGSSAGLMFALGVLDAVTEGDLTRGHLVAGTGTIDVDGAVGPVGGAGEKVTAAERDGARLFLVPRQNYEEARRRARRAQVVPVGRFEEAVRALCELPGGGAPPPLCTIGLAGGPGR